MPLKRPKRILFRYFWDNDDGIASLHFRIGGTERFPKQAFDPVALNAFPLLFSYGNTHIRLLRRTVYHSQRGGKGALAFGKKFLKVRLFFQS